MKKKDKPISKKWILISVAIAVAVYSLIGFLIWPAKAYLSSDAVYTDTLLPDMLNYASDILEIGVVSFFYATMIVLLYKYNKGMTVLSVAFVVITAYKYLVNTAMTWYNTGSIPLMWYWDLADVIFYTLLEVIQLFVIYLFVKRFIDEFGLLRETKLKFATEYGGEVPPIQEPYPFKRLFDLKNCLLNSALVCAGITFVAKVSGVIMGDVWYIILNGWPTLAETWLLMLLNYASMILSGILVYFFVIGAEALMLREKK